MHLDHTFTVPAGVDQAWQVLLDIERVAPCLPGASLDSVEGDHFTGTVKVRLGPIGLTYKGKASFVEKDEAAHRVMIDAQGRDSRGNGTASAKVTASLEPDGEQATRVAVHTDLTITGKPAQFGRGVLADVGNKLIGQFADCLAGKLAGPGATEEPEVAPTVGPAESVPPPAAESAAATAGTSESAAAETVEQAASATPATGEPPSTLEEAVSTGDAPSVSTDGSTAAPPPGERSSAEQPAVAGAGTAAIAEPAALSGGTGPSSATAVSPGQPSRHAAPEVEPINLLSSAGPAVLKRLAPVAVAAVLAIVLYVILRRRR
ncbi:MAG TPA: SRPBCC domain-containing protein [Jatrophihabitans sp.]|nr:SRPBCC domain-containing protein [Jatrophihabitans sp.]